MGLWAAALFGLSAPIAKRLLAHATPEVLAGLLYLGAGLGLTSYRRFRPSSIESPLLRADIPKLAAVILLGGVLGPVLMLQGLTRTSAVTGSLLLNLEAVFTIVIAVVVFREHLGRYAACAIAFVVTGAAVLKLEPGAQGAEGPGIAFLAAACACWALDNNLTQRLSLRDPFAIVKVKALSAGVINLILGFIGGGGKLPPLIVIATALIVGLFSYGISVVLDTYALRLIGAAREAAYFATAPFLGALAATVIVGEPLRGADVLAMLTMAVGVALLVRERHSHEHTHEAHEHAHVHTHDEHHQHAHDPGDPPGDRHTHHHRHAPLIHDHPHVPDLHHRHTHSRAPRKNAP